MPTLPKNAKAPCARPHKGAKDIPYQNIKAFAFAAKYRKSIAYMRAVDSDVLVDWIKFVILRTFLLKFQFLVRNKKVINLFVTYFRILFKAVST